MKTWMKIVLGAVGAIALIVGVVFWATSGLTDTADEFFDAAQDETDAAYALTSKDFQSSVSKEELASFLASMGLDNVAETSWSGRSISNNVGTLEGTVTLANGAVSPLTLQMVKEGGGWKILSIDKQASGIAQDAADIPIPSADRQTAMVESATSAFVASLRDPDFSRFRREWVEDMTLENLETNFGSMRPHRDHFRMLAASDADIEPATMRNPDGGVTIVGSYDIDPNIYQFSYGFVPLSRNDWKLIDFEFTMDPK